MKKIFLFLAGSALLLLASCTKEEGVNANGAGDTVTFTVTAEGATKAVADNDGHAAGVNHWIMEVRDGNGSVYNYQEDDATAGVLTHNFTVRLVKGQQYQALFWADTKGTYDVSDLTNVKLLAAESAGYAANKDTRDAFSCADDSFTFSGASQRAVTLKRPFGQLNIIFTDLDDLYSTCVDSTEYLTYRPCSLNVSAMLPTTFNVKTQAAGDPVSTPLAITAAGDYLDNYCSHRAEETIFMDYFFATAGSSDVVDVDFNFTASGAVIAHSFTNIPFQRNYRTNIKGDLMVTDANWNVTIDPIWTNNGTGKFEVIVLAADNVEDAQALINANAGAQSVDKTVEIQIKDEISSKDTLYIPDNTTTPNWVFKIENMTSGGEIVVEDETPLNDDVNYKKSAEVALPSGVTASQATFNTPNAHGVVSGDFGRIDATTSATTLEIKADATVDELYVHKGNVALYGQVDHIYRAEGNTSIVTVNIYDGAVWTNWAAEKESAGIAPVVNLGTYTFDPTGYNVEGSTVFANPGSSPATWTVSVTNEWQYYTAESFSNVSGTTITIMNAAELALFAKNVNDDVNYTGYTIKLGADINLGAHAWTPIMLDEGCATNLTFDGDDRTISGLWINQRKESNTALFGTYFSHGTIIRDLTLKSPIVSQVQDPDKIAQEAGLNYTAALVAHMGCGVVDNCSVIDGTINGQDQVGAIVGYVACGDVKNCTVEHCMVDAEVGRAGGLAGKVNTDSEYEISNNVVRRTSVSAGQKFDGMLSAGALVGQIMTGDGDTWYIKDNTIENVQTATDEDNTFVPVGEFRKGYFKADAFTGGYIVNNTWDDACADTDRYNMVNPADTSEFVTIWNGTHL